MNIFFAVVAAMLLSLCAQPAHAGRYAVARSATPVMNAAAMNILFGGGDGRTLKTDRCGQVRELEFMALPGTVFRVLDEVRQGDTVVYRVKTDDYPTPAGGALYVDRRFMEMRSEQPAERLRSMPERETVISALKVSVGSPYVWGGNMRQGINELLELYYRGSFLPAEARRLALAGLDCSGLLFAATNGCTPRNTSRLVEFGRGVPVAGKGALELATLLQPLDLIVWSGHVIIVLDSETVIESRLECGSPGRGGVMTTPLRQRLAEIMRARRPLDAWPKGGKQRDGFVVRRWYGLQGGWSE
ncbi:MAG: peptidoglycan endopeptidase [Desulfuromonadales bacterium]|nr:peptidoglycan endopeptidase [Desulfuromonadales bacterium]